MSTGYTSGYHERSASAGEAVKKPSPSGWSRALRSARDALATFREAESQREDGDGDSADMSLLVWMRLLKERYHFSRYIPSMITYFVLAQEPCRLCTNLGSS